MQLREANIPPFMDLLLFLDSVELDSLSAEESELAHALDEENFIKISNGTCQSTGLQLISFTEIEWNSTLRKSYNAYRRKSRLLVGSGQSMHVLRIEW